MQLQWNQIAEFYSARLPPAIFCQACPSWGNQELEQEMCVCYGHSCTARKTTINLITSFQIQLRAGITFYACSSLNTWSPSYMPMYEWGIMFFNGSVGKIRTVSINLTITFLYPIPIQFGRALLALFQKNLKNYQNQYFL